MKENDFGILMQIIVGANVFTGALTNSKFTRLVVEKYQRATIQCKLIKWKVNTRIWSFLRNKSWNSSKCKIHMSHLRMLQKFEKSGIKWCLSSHFSLPAKFQLIQSGIFAPIIAHRGGAIALIFARSKLLKFVLFPFQLFKSSGTFAT